MTRGTSVETGPPLEPDAEAEHRRQVAEMYADQAEGEVKVIEAKLAGMKQALVNKKAEAKALRAESWKAGD